MSGCGIGCVVFIWVSFLWPILVTIAYLMFKGAIRHKAKYFLASVIVGYLLFATVTFLGSFLVRQFIDIDRLMDGNLNIELLTGLLFVISVLAHYIPPILSSHMLAKRFSKPQPEMTT